MKKNILIYVCLGLLLTACTKSQPIYKFDQEKFSLAIAPFYNPKNSLEMLAGYYPLDKNINATLLRELDLELENLLNEREVNFISYKLVRPCLELVSAKKTISIFDFWVQVGKCVPSDYLLIPYLYRYQERKGNEYGVISPASVEFDLFLLDVKGQKIAYRYHFDETQLSLSENLLNFRKFVSRKGKWIKAKELVKEGLDLGLGEMGL